MKKYFNSAKTVAHENFSNYSGNGGWNNFNDPYNYAGGGSGAPEAASLPYTVQVANSTASDVAGVVILGSNENLYNATNFGNPASIALTMDNGDITYTQFLESIKSQPFMVGKTYIETVSGSSQQPFQALTITNKEANGRLVQFPVSPRRDPMQNQTGVTIVKYRFAVNSFTKIETTIKASTTVIYSFYPMSQLDLSRTLVGQSVDKPFADPNLSQFNMPTGVLAGRG